MASKGTKDYLKECMDSINQEGTVPEFQAAFCNVCQNPDCMRSAWGDSRWLQRMKRQEAATYSPIIVPANFNEEALKAAAQDFVTLDKSVNFYGGFLDVAEDGKVVHHADPDTQSKPGSKLESSVTSLKKSLSDEPEAPETPLEEESEGDVIEEEEVAQKPSQSAVERVEVPVKPPPKDPVDKKKGIMLSGAPQSQIQRPSVSPDMSDPWAAPSPARKGPVKVRIDTGKKIDE